MSLITCMSLVFEVSDFRVLYAKIRLVFEPSTSRSTAVLNPSKYAPVRPLISATSLSLCDTRIRPLSEFSVSVYSVMTM